jgi:hypothetical protein
MVGCCDMRHPFRNSISKPQSSGGKFFTVPRQKGLLRKSSFFEESTDNDTPPAALLA